MRKGLYLSRPLVALRVLRAVKIPQAIEHSKRFGFVDKLPVNDLVQLPRDLSLALGSGYVSPLQLTTGYATFANGGFRITPYYIDQVLQENKKPRFSDPPVACPRRCDKTQTRRAPRVISAQNAYLMTVMLRDTVQRGIAARARTLQRNDIAGMPGDTEDHKDAWFVGYTPELVASVFIGFENTSPLGHAEGGVNAALPAWIDFMRSVLAGSKESHLPLPKGMITIRIDPETGLRATDSTKNPELWPFRRKLAPRRYS